MWTSLLHVWILPRWSWIICRLPTPSRRHSSRTNWRRQETQRSVTTIYQRTETRIRFSGGEMHVHIQLTRASPSRAGPLWVELSDGDSAAQERCSSSRWWSPAPCRTAGLGCAAWAAIWKQTWVWRAAQGAAVRPVEARNLRRPKHLIPFDRC